MAIRARLREELARRDTLTAQLARLDETPTLDAEAIVQDVQARAVDLRGLLARHVAQARQVVKLLLDWRLVCQPFDDGTERGYTFTATGTYRRLGVPVVESVNAGGGPNGTRANLHNSSARFHCALIIGAHALRPLQGPTLGFLCDVVAKNPISNGDRWMSPFQIETFQIETGPNAPFDLLFGSPLL